MRRRSSAAMEPRWVRVGGPIGAYEIVMLIIICELDMET